MNQFEAICLSNSGVAVKMKLWEFAIGRGFPAMKFAQIDDVKGTQGKLQLKKVWMG